MSGGDTVPNCKYINSLFSDVIDNSVSEETLRSFSTHICICKQCSLRYKKMRGIVDNLRSLPKAELPTNFHEILMSKTAQRRKQRRLPAFLNLKNVSAAAVAVCLVSFVYAVISGSPVKDIALVSMGNSADKSNVQKSSVDFIADGSVSVNAPVTSQLDADSPAYDDQGEISHEANGGVIIDETPPVTFSASDTENTASRSESSKISPSSSPKGNSGSYSSGNKKPSDSSSDSKSKPGSSVSKPKASSAPSSSESKSNNENQQSQSSPSPNAEILSSVRTSSRTILVSEALFNQKVASGEVSVMNSFFESGVYKVVVSSSDFDKISRASKPSDDDKYVFVVESIK